MHSQQKKKILLVGLEQPTFTVLKKGIDELSGQFELLRVQSGTRALEEIDSGHFPVILVNAFLTDMTGLHLSREIKSESQNSEVIMIVPAGVSCFNNLEFTNDVDHLIKEPISIAHIQQLIKDSFRRDSRLLRPLNSKQLERLDDSKPAIDPKIIDTDEPVLFDMESLLRIDPSSLSLDEKNIQDHDEEIHQALLNLRHSTNSSCMMLLSSSGCVVDSVGDTNRLNVTNISALIAANYKSASELAKFVGNDASFNSTHHAGTNYDIFTYGLNDDFLIVSIFDSNSKIGLVRFGIKEVSNSLVKLLHTGNRSFDVTDTTIGSNIEQELDKLFVG